MKKTSVTETIEKIPGGIRISGIGEYSVAKTFDCGQCFRFDPVPLPGHETHVGGVAMGKLISIGQDKNGEIFLYGVSEEEYLHTFRHFLAIDDDYAEVKRIVTEALPDEEGRSVMRQAAELSRGIRILHQDSWETLCSFIISQNNNIPRIKKLVNAVCAAGKVSADTSIISMPQAGFAEAENAEGTALSKNSAEYNGSGAFMAFPPPESLIAMGEEGIFALRTGFRAGYLYDAAVKTVSGEVTAQEVLSASSYDDAAACLSRIRGVGPKVAACTLLFGYGRGDAFPVDVWIKRIMAERFPNGLNPDAFGEYAGIAQQYLFYAGRFA